MCCNYNDMALNLNNGPQCWLQQLWVLGSSKEDNFSFLFTANVHQTLNT